MGNPKESLTVCDIGSDNKLQVGNMIPTKDGRLEKVYIDRTSQLLVSTAIAIADLIKMSAKNKAY